MRTEALGYNLMRHVIIHPNIYFRALFYHLMTCTSMNADKLIHFGILHAIQNHLEFFSTILGI